MTEPPTAITSEFRRRVLRRLHDVTGYYKMTILNLQQTNPHSPLLLTTRMALGDAEMMIEYLTTGRVSTDKEN